MLENLHQFIVLALTLLALLALFALLIEGSDVNSEPGNPTP